MRFPEQPAAPPKEDPGTSPEADLPPMKSPAPSISPAAPAFDAYGRRERPPCKRVYNERDCCEEERKCMSAREKLRLNSIRNISLDITPSFKPDAETLTEEREARDNQLRLMPARSWRNRDGVVVGEGRLTRLTNRRAVIQSSQGEEHVVPFQELGDDELCFLAAWWGVPSECTLGDQEHVARQWEPVTLAWTASALCHKPLYFEEVQLERYGHTAGPIFQPVKSGAHFFANIAVLPYKMGINPANECRYALGYYRPGNCAPWLVPPVPISLRGALFQAGAVMGVVGLFP
jgi:hypothetical protein